MSKQGLHRKFSIFANQFKSKRYSPGTIAIPVYRSLMNEFLDTIDQLEVPEGTVVMRKEGSYVGKNREWLANNFQGEWVFFVDSDEIFPPQTIMRLLSHNLPIVSGLYFKRGDDFAPQVWKSSGYSEAEKTEQYTPMISVVGDYLKRHRDELVDGHIVKMLEKPELLECDAVGGGCLLVQRDALARMEKPFFGSKLAEDLAFCENARKSGLKIYADLSIMVGHLYQVAVGYPHMLARNGYVRYD